jgi:hypothetical protein
MAHKGSQEAQIGILAYKERMHMGPTRGKITKSKLLKFFTGWAALGACLVAMDSPASADLITNGSFEITNPSHTAINDANLAWGSCPTCGWTTGAPANGTNIVYAPGTATTTSNLNWQVWALPATSLDGGNFEGSDGDSTVRTPFSQTIESLDPGVEYALSFSQAAGQKVACQQRPTVDCKGSTTEQWQVSLGSQTELSPLMSDDSQSDVPWQPVTLYFTPTSGIETLSFLALGTPNGLPPMVFLDGVSLVATPEPGSYALLGTVLVLVGFATRRLRNRRA